MRREADPNFKRKEKGKENPPSRSGDRALADPKKGRSDTLF